MAADGKNVSGTQEDGLVCPKCGVGLEAEVTLRGALDERVESKRKDLAVLREQEAEMAKARLHEVEQRLNAAQAEAEALSRSAMESQARKAELRCVRDRIEAELQSLRAEAMAARHAQALCGAGERGG